MDSLPYEQRMKLAIDVLNSQEVPTYRAVAKEHQLCHSTLMRRFKGETTDRATATSEFRKALTDVQEELLIDRINYLTRRNLQPSPGIVKNMAEEVRGAEVGRNWVSEFVKRRSDSLLSKYIKNMDSNRTTSEYTPVFEHYFRTIFDIIDEYNISPCNMYNWDEKGFLIGFARRLRRIMTRDEYESGRSQAAKQDGSREFVSLLATICGDGSTLSPGLIYKGEHLQDTWFQDVEDEEKVFVGCSTNGWSSDNFGLNYLKRVFDLETREKAGRGKRLLIVDGHSSHVNYKFITTCFQLRILVVILPPHTTHRLQPLDVGMFQPLAQAYSAEQQRILDMGEELVALSKRSFYSMFRSAWKRSFTNANILSAWRKCGIIPRDENLILNQIRPRKEPRPEGTPQRALASRPLKPPLTSKSIRRFKREYRQNPTADVAEMLINANFILAGDRAIAWSRIEQLQEMVKLGKTKRKRGKKLDLLGRELEGKCQFYSGEEIQAAKRLQQEKEAFEEDEVARKQQKKLDAAVKKNIKDVEKLQKALQASILNQERQEKKAKEQEEKATRAHERALAKAEKEAVKAQQKASIALQKPAVTKKNVLRTPKRRKRGNQAPVILRPTSPTLEVGNRVSRAGRQVWLTIRAKGAI